MFTSIYMEFQYEKACFTYKMKIKHRFPLCFKELAKMAVLQNYVSKLLVLPAFICISFIC